MYAISDTEVIIKRNVPSNALQNKNQHCTVLQLNWKGVSYFPAVACTDQGKKVSEFWDTEYVAPDWLQKWRWNLNKSWLHRVHCLEEWYLWKAHFWIYTLQHLPKQCCWGRDFLSTHAHEHPPHNPEPLLVELTQPLPQVQSKTNQPCSGEPLLLTTRNPLARFYSHPLHCTTVPE